MASLSPWMPGTADASSGLLERRLCAEWTLLRQLVALNPTRLRGASMEDCTMQVNLSATPALSLGSAVIAHDHTLRIEYPRFFPAVPLELYLGQPMQHPNIHPESGFVCLWDQHRVSHNVEHAIHKTAAILGWRLMNLTPEHVMQTDAASLAPERDTLMTLLQAPPLLGNEHDISYMNPTSSGRRTRLS